MICSDKMMGLKNISRGWDALPAIYSRLEHAWNHRVNEFQTSLFYSSGKSKDGTSVTESNTTTTDAALRSLMRTVASGFQKQAAQRVKRFSEDHFRQLGLPLAEEDKKVFIFKDRNILVYIIANLTRMRPYICSDVANSTYYVLL